MQQQNAFRVEDSGRIGGLCAQQGLLFWKTWSRVALGADDLSERGEGAASPAEAVQNKRPWLAQAPDDLLLAAGRGVVWHGLAADLLVRDKGQVAGQTTQLFDYFQPALRFADNAT
ncbi:MAG: hypothetical protein HY302_01800 [Opitutae bacterium]|nr:hypothetical protein [Opitutae bacterium]